MRAYAQGTDVPVEKSRAEIDRLLSANGATTTAILNNEETSVAAIAFTMKGARFRIELPLPTTTDVRKAAQTRRGIDLGQLRRERWRAVLLLLKSKLEIVRIGLSSVEREFMADMVLPRRGDGAPGARRGPPARPSGERAAEDVARNGGAMIGLFLRSLHVDHLRAVVLAVWAVLAPASARSVDADALATGIALAVDADPSPVWEDGDLEAAVSGVYAWHESRVRLAPTPWRDPRTGRVVDSEARGAFQLHSEDGDGDAFTQASAWLALLHDGALRCPSSPAAPLSGSCLLARRLADRRVRMARQILTGSLLP